jgi:UDP-2,3-diacylglucosamine pyrophosphatase LpxH
MSALLTFEELHVVSDLHLGGQSEERQIFNQGESFAALVKELLHRTPESQGLVINGDLVDFLAEPDAVYFDPAGAAGKLDRIIRDPSFVPVWDALREFVKPENRQLIITLGNHDLELALPWVRQHLLAELTRDCPTARDRITLAFVKWGYSCRVGNASVRCVHGNEVDSWNVTNYEALQRIADGATEIWAPNAGSRLVIDVMNGIKATYPFVDLLKPETPGVLTTLFVLQPSLLERAPGAIPAGIELTVDSVRRRLGLLGQEALGPAAKDTEPSSALLQMLGGRLGPDVAWQKDRIDLNALLRDVEQRYRAGTDPLALVRPAAEPDFLGFWGAVKNVVLFRGRDEVLRQALEDLGKDRSFDLLAPDDTSRALGEQVPGSPDFVTAGHTHLERALPLDGGARFYFNSGTWVRLIQLTREVLASRDAFQPVYTALAAGKMKALDDREGLVLRRCPVISFWADGSRTHGELRHVVGGELQAVSGTHFVKG